MSPPLTQMSADDIMALVRAGFPRLEQDLFAIETILTDRVRLRMFPREEDIRPGGTISGPTLMALADTAAWMVVLAGCGPVLGAVTSSLRIDFLRRPPPGPLLAEARPLKIGRRLAVIDIAIFTEVHDGPPEDREVAHAGVTYALPGG